MSPYVWNRVCFTYSFSGISVEYISVLVSARRTAFIPRRHTLDPQNIQSRLYTFFSRNVGCNSDLLIFRYFTAKERVFSRICSRSSKPQWNAGTSSCKATCVCVFIILSWFSLVNVTVYIYNRSLHWMVVRVVISPNNLVAMRIY